MIPLMIQSHKVIRLTSKHLKVFVAKRLNDIDDLFRVDYPSTNHELCRLFGCLDSGFGNDAIFKEVSESEILCTFFADCLVWSFIVYETDVSILLTYLIHTM